MQSTYDQISSDPKRRKRIDKEYQTLVISEVKQQEQYRDFWEYLIESLKDIEIAQSVFMSYFRRMQRLR